MGKTVFDHVKAIYENQSPQYFEELTDADVRTFQPYMINRILSMNLELLPIVNELQSHGTIGSREMYLFYSNILPKGKQFHKYIKGAKEEKYAPWLVELVARHFSVSKVEAEEYIKLYFLSDPGKEELRGLCQMYAVEPKDIKKVKL